MTVTLAAGIPEGVVRSVNLNYLDPAALDIAALEADPTRSSNRTLVRCATGCVEADHSPGGESSAKNRCRGGGGAADDQYRGEANVLVLMG